MNKTHQKIVIFESASDDFTATVKERASGVPPPPKISIQPNIHRAIPHPPPPPLFPPPAAKVPKSPKNIPSPPAPPQIFKNPVILQFHRHIPNPPPPPRAPPNIPVDVSPQMNIKFHIPVPPPPPAPTPPKMLIYNYAIRDISHIPDAPPLPNSNFEHDECNSKSKGKRHTPKRYGFRGEYANQSDSLYFDSSCDFELDVSNETAKRAGEYYNEGLESYGKTIEKYAKRMEKYQDDDVKVIESSETDEHSQS
ncbi:hypothetical protein HDV04_000603 [Boothiomyces sp. JEL0838]|nr:hypothetical protein HDV04_000603 [Boothiomyces sp. JEL0838]